jgi:cytochrome c
VPDFDSYSDAMKTSTVVWSEETIDAYLANPASFMPGNGMAGSAGNLEDATQRRDLIDFLKEPDNSQDLCF